MPIKVAVIGAGSIGFTRRLMKDILSVSELQSTHFAFHDISKNNLEMITNLAKRDIAANKVPATITTSTNRRRALEGADYVLNLTRIGGLEAFKHDIDQCVGDTICAGGFVFGMDDLYSSLNPGQSPTQIIRILNPGRNTYAQSSP
ncbi:MAG: hypothetical protein QGG64_20050 [Candidatus Latescibacteria bacterium]|nr:hypothetical protein [Candidatus Latescibacterota bacterium]